MSKKKVTFQVGDLIQAEMELFITNEDDTEEEADADDIFMIIENDDTDKEYEYTLIRQKTLKISTWSRYGIGNNFRKV